MPQNRMLIVAVREEVDLRSPGRFFTVSKHDGIGKRMIPRKACGPVGSGDLVKADHRAAAGYPVFPALIRS